MPFTDQEILETVRMIELETLDIRTITLGINQLDCADPDLESACEKVYAKIVHHAQGLVAVGDGIARDYGIPIVNKRIATTRSEEHTYELQSKYDLVCCLQHSEQSQSPYRPR